MGILHVQATLSNAVGRHNAPPLCLHGAAVEMRRGMLLQIERPAVAAESQHPGNRPHNAGGHCVNIVRRQDAVLAFDDRIIHCHIAVTCQEHGAPGGAAGCNMGVIYSDLSFIADEHTGTEAHKVISAVAIHLQRSVIYGIIALSAQVEPVEVLLPADNGDVLCLMVVIAAALNCRLYGHFRHIGAVHYADACPEGIRSQGNALCHSQDNVPFIDTGNHFTALSAHRHGHELSLRRSDLCAGL